MQGYSLLQRGRSEDIDHLVTEILLKALVRIESNHPLSPSIPPTSSSVPQSQSSSFSSIQPSYSPPALSPTSLISVINITQDQDTTPNEATPIEKQHPIIGGWLWKHIIQWPIFILVSIKKFVFGVFWKKYV